MTGMQLNQLEYESKTWKRLLGFMSDETVRLKNRLGEIMKLQNNNELLIEAESFHHRFLKEDMLMNLLRDDIADLDKVLLQKEFNDSRIGRDVRQRVKKLRDNIRMAEEEFSKLKEEFNNYMLENI